MKKLILLFLAFIIVIVIAGFWFVNGLTPKDNNSQTKRFVIDQGETASAIGIDLAKNNLIKSATAFRIYSQVTQTARKIKPGSYDLSSNQWVPQIIAKLLNGPTEIWVTIPEGLRKEEIAEKFTDFDKFNKQEFLNLTKNDEGYLFPDTYLLPRDATASTIVKIMTDNFNKQYTEAAKNKTNPLSKNDIVILASIVQREAITAEDMRGVASVLMNRYNSGMSLGSDVTLEYALGQQPDGGWWKKDLTVDDLALDSPYNTRTNAGFPPTPISNPGLVALEAAANPPNTSYLYYLSDSDGKLHFAQTLEEHNANIQKYLQ
ncbi:MAG TPA: endolytic transglycosylase MltG [Patescibacteria group bacterium]|nr:endolytic transglycosylase MltG [Patescibacteria group bacterium]